MKNFLVILLLFAFGSISSLPPISSVSFADEMIQKIVFIKVIGPPEPNSFTGKTTFHFGAYMHKEDAVPFNQWDATLPMIILDVKGVIDVLRARPELSDGEIVE